MATRGRTVRIDEATDEVLIALAEKEGRSKAEIIRRAILSRGDVPKPGQARVFRDAPLAESRGPSVSPTKGQRRTVADAAARSEASEKCRHPLLRRIGNQCAVCGQSVGRS